MVSGGVEPFHGVSSRELRRRLVEAGDRRLDALSVAEAQEARREQAILISELQHRGEPLEEPEERMSGTSPRPGLMPSDVRPLRPEERSTRATGRSVSGPGVP